ncbi:MAG: cobalamin biosynthesis protein, partial [Lachnospiraceae bacterium]|nr:cobalamin biosynthesis protein [Lachnospiraceae bacterium]
MREILTAHTIALLAGALLDWIVGDPHGFPHPIRAIGSLILALERRLLEETEDESVRDAEDERTSGDEGNAGDGKYLEDGRAAESEGNSGSEKGLGSERNPKSERRAGFLLWFVVVSVAVLISIGILVLSYRASLYIGLVVEAIMTCYLLAAGSLYRESMAVSKALQKNDKEGAAKALSMIVGRDTENLSEEEIVKAAVETV